MPELTFIVVRHAVTPWNREQRFQGHTDIDLDTDGEEQAARIALRISRREVPPQAVYSSDLRRATSTAAAIAVPLGLTVRTTPLLRETMLGDWEGLTHAEIEARGDGHQLALYRIDSYRHRPPGAETLDQVWERMGRAFDLLRANHTEGTIVVVGHGGSLRALLCHAISAPVTTMRHLWLSNAGMSIIEVSSSSGEQMSRIVLMNDTSHLDS